MAKAKATKNFTSGSIPRLLVMFALPFMASNALQVLYSTIDMIIVGNFVGTDGISAVSQSSQIVNFATMICLGFSNAGQVLLAQALGAGKRKEATNVIGTLFVFITSLAIVLTAVILSLTSFIIDTINVPTEARDMAFDYVTICTAGLIFTAGYNMVSAVLRGMGDAKRPLLFIGIASGVNLVLDLLFTGLFGWGVAGAAWATVIGQAASFIFSIFYLYAKRASFGFEFDRRSFIPNKRYVKMIGSLGAPMAIQSGFINISMLAVNSLVNSLDNVVASATFGIGVRIDDIINKLCLGIQHAAVPIISQNIGAGKPERAKHAVYTAWIFAGVLTLIFMALYLLIGQEMFKLFSSDPAVHEMSWDFIRAILCMFPAFALMRGSGAFIEGIGNSKFNMVLSVLDGFALRIGLSWLFGIYLDLGFFGFVLGYGLAPYGSSVPGTIYFLSGRWRRRKALAEDL